MSKKRERREALERGWPSAEPTPDPVRPAGSEPASGYETTWWEYTGRMGAWRSGVSSPMMRSLKTGEECEQAALPIGALWAMTNQHNYYPAGPDGLSIACLLPDGTHWHIDSRASNCTLKEDNAHRCWVRHGTVNGRLTVDKAGNTCRAGSGSIQTGKYHGYLRGGRLVRS